VSCCWTSKCWRNALYYEVFWVLKHPSPAEIYFQKLSPRTQKNICFSSVILFNRNNRPTRTLQPLDAYFLHFFPDHSVYFRQFLKVGKICGRFLGVRGPIFTKLGEDIWPSSARSPSLFQISLILFHFGTRAALCRVVSKMWRNFALFDPLWKLGEC